MLLRPAAGLLGKVLRFKILHMIDLMFVME
jgi:hypothetical protein